MKANLKKNLCAGFFCAAIFFLYGCQQPLEDSVFYESEVDDTGKIDAGQGTLTLSGAEAGKDYAADVYAYTGDTIENYEAYSGATGDNNWIGTGVSSNTGASVIRLKIPQDSSIFFWREGKFLVVITQYNADGTKDKVFYQPAVAFDNKGCAGIDLATEDVKDRQDLLYVAVSHLGNLSLTNTDEQYDYAADIYSYSGAIAHYTAYAAHTIDAYRIGTGISSAPVSLVQLKNFRDSDLPFWQKGHFLVVITEYNGHAVQRVLYQTGVSFDEEGCASIDLTGADVSDRMNLLTEDEVGVFTLDSTSAGHVYSADIYYSGGGDISYQSDYAAATHEALKIGVGGPYTAEGNSAILPLTIARGTGPFMMEGEFLVVITQFNAGEVSVRYLPGVRFNEIGCALIDLADPAIENRDDLPALPSNQGVLTLIGPNTSHSYAADVYAYSGAISDYAAYAAYTADSYRIGAGMSPAPVSTIQLHTPQDNSRAFFQNGPFLVVITEYTDSGLVQKILYSTDVTFTNGCADVNLSAFSDRDLLVEVQGVLTLSGTNASHSYAADVYAYSYAITNYSDYAAYTADSYRIGAGISPAPVSTIQLHTPQDNSRAFFQNGTFLVVITEYAASGLVQKILYSTVGDFDKGCATVNLSAFSNREGLLLTTEDPGVLTLTKSTNNCVYSAAVYAYSGGVSGYAQYSNASRDALRIGAGSVESGGTSTAIPLSDAERVFTRDGAYLVVVTEIKDSVQITTRYQVQARFTNGAATVNWQTMTSRPTAPPTDPSDGTLLYALNVLMPAAAGQESLTITLNSEPETFDRGALSYNDGNHHAIESGCSPRNLTINGNGKIVTLKSSWDGASLLLLGKGVTLTLENITLVGHTSNKEALVTIYQTGTLILGAGAVITGNSSEDTGGVLVDGSRLIMNGGVISYNSTSTTDGPGGGVKIIGNNSTFIMNSGVIAHNVNNDVVGGGVYVKTGTFTMNGGVISYNKTTQASSLGRGGGVYVGEDSNFTMNDGVISHNISGNGGGGVYVSENGTFTMNGGMISENTAKENGGGVYAAGDVTGPGLGLVLGNTAGNEGNDIYRRQ
jgi:predicted outer membrane repeat protein